MFEETALTFREALSEHRTENADEIFCQPMLSS
jgi:hypothetical protein